MSAATESPPRTLRDWSGTIEVAAVAAAASVIGITNEFVNDDIHLIANNVRVQSMTNWHDWFALPFWPPPFSPDLYRPLTSALLAFEYTLGNGAPMVFRIGSYLVYALVCLAVFALCRRMMPRPFALAAAVLFAAHPVHVEAVALAVGQSELVVGLLAVVMCIRYIDRRRASALGPRDWAIFVALYLIAALTKEQGLILPALLVAAELCLFPGTWRERARALLPVLLSMAVVAAGILVVRYRVLGGVGGTFPAEALIGVGIGGRILTMLAMVPQWTRLFLWPYHLRADYSPQEFVASTGFGFAEAAGLVILVAVTVSAWQLRRRAPGFTFGIAWCAIALLPVANVFVVTGIMLAERTLFLPSMGLVIAILSLAHAAAAAEPETRMLPFVHHEHWKRRATLAFNVIALLGVLRSVERQRVWQNEGTFVVRGVQNSPRSFRMQRAYGDLLFDLEQPALAFAAYDRAMQYSPPSQVWRVHNDLATTLMRKGDFVRQAEHLAISLRQNPEQEFRRGQLVAAYTMLGEYSQAAAQADSGLAHGAKQETFGRMKVVLDSAVRVHAPAGSIKVGVEPGTFSAVR